MTLWRPWTIVLRGKHSGSVSPITFLRFFTRAGAEKWLHEWQVGGSRATPKRMNGEKAREIRLELLDAYVERVDRVKDSEHNQEHDDGSRDAAVPPVG